MPLGMEVGLGADPAPPPQRATAPNFRFLSVVAKRPVGSRCHALGMEVSLGPGHIVLNGDPATLPKKGQSPQFSAHVYCGHGRPSQLLLSSCMKLSMCQCNLVHLTDIL